MAKSCLVVKQRREPKFSVRKYHRCKSCGRARALFAAMTCAVYVSGN